MVHRVIILGLIALSGVAHGRSYSESFLGFGQPHDSNQSFTKENMVRGIQGVTVVDVGDPKGSIVIKDNAEYFCPENVTSVDMANRCVVPHMRFSASTLREYCRSVRYAKKDGVLCIPSSDTSLVEITEDLRCISNDKSETQLLSEQDYKQICGRLPWENLYKYYSTTASKIPKEMCLYLDNAYCAFFLMIQKSSLRRKGDKVSFEIQQTTHGQSSSQWPGTTLGSTGRQNETSQSYQKHHGKPSQEYSYGSNDKQSWGGGGNNLNSSLHGYSKPQGQGPTPGTYGQQGGTAGGIHGKSNLVNQQKKLGAYGREDGEGGSPQINLLPYGRNGKPQDGSGGSPQKHIKPLFVQPQSSRPDNGRTPQILLKPEIKDGYLGCNGFGLQSTNSDYLLNGTHDPPCVKVESQPKFGGGILHDEVNNVLNTTSEIVGAHNVNIDTVINVNREFTGNVQLPEDD